MNSTLFYTASLGPSVEVPTAMYTPPLRYKREALAAHNGFFSKLTQTQAIQHTVDVGYYAPAAQTTLNPSMFSCSYTRSVRSSKRPRVLQPQGRAGAFCHPAVGLHTTTIRYTDVQFFKLSKKSIRVQYGERLVNYQTHYTQSCFHECGGNYRPMTSPGNSWKLLGK